MSAPLTLPSGTTGFHDESGAWICTGSRMGRADCLPDNRAATGKLRLQRLPFVDGCYDRWGAYWGAPANVWCAWGDLDGEDLTTRLFLRADSRDEAKRKVREQLPGVTFHR